MKNFIKVVFPFALLVLAFQSCTGSKEVFLNESPDIEFVEPTWQEIVPGQEDGKKMIVVFLPIANQDDNYAIDSIYFQGYHQNMTFKSKASAGSGYQAIITVGETKNSIEAPYELANNQALVSYIDSNKARRYFRVSDIKRAESIYMP